MRVLLVNDLAPGPTGGAEVHVAHLRDALRRSGDDVEAFHADGDRRGVRRVFDLWDPLARRRLAERVERFHPQVIHYHNVLNELSTSVVGLGVPSVLTVHDARILGGRVGYDHGRSTLVPAVALRGAKNRFARSRLRRHVGSTVAPSTELADALRGAGFPRVRLITNFTPAVAPTPVGTDVVFVGTLARYKGPQVVVEAFVRVADQHPGTRLHLVGDGPLRAELDATVRAAGLGGRVCFHGSLPSDSVTSVLQLARVVAVPSLGVEGGGPTMVVIEAMAAGRPVVVSDRPGVREGVDPTVGAVVAAGDPAALAEAIGALLGDPQRAGEIGAAARDRARARWSPESAVDRVHAVYQEVLDEHS